MNRHGSIRLIILHTVYNLTTQAAPKEIKTAVIIGAGNLAWHLGHALVDAGLEILQVFNRTPETGQSLARELNTVYTGLPGCITKKADIYIIALSDNAISDFMASDCFHTKSLVVHTAGSVNIDVFAGTVENYGVFYPLQTFTRGKPVDFRKIPVFIEANNPHNEDTLKHLAIQLSNHVYAVDSEKRMYLHLAAVIACNFVNHLFAIVDKMLAEKQLNISLLEPLIRETVTKALQISPAAAQTGPAIRGNTKTIAKHLALLEKHPGIRELYRVLSDSIMAAGIQQKSL
jgi:predicted short-subunit dehydrogenase-like oxidoreductase (DUF2520 family)